jgi:uncharacterized lipoprotein YmbA
VTAAAPRCLALAALAALAAGCTILAPAQDPSRFFVLAAAGGAASGQSDLALGVGPVHLASYLAVPEIQVRASATEVRRGGVDRWAEPLEEGIARVLAQDLSAILGTREVVLFPWYAEQRPACQVQLSVRRFELEPDGSGLLEARYEVTDLVGRTPHVVRDVELRRPAAGSDTAASVAALSEALAALAEQIAADVRRVVSAGR